jgi:hypothetical protein
MAIDLRSAKQEISRREEASRYEFLQTTFVEPDEDWIWYSEPRTRGSGHRVVSIWRFFRVSSSQVCLEWRLGAVLGASEKPNSEGSVWSFVTPDSLEEEKGGTSEGPGPMRCRSESALVRSVATYSEYRVREHEALRKAALRSLGGVLQISGLLPYIERVGRERGLSFLRWDSALDQQKRRKLELLWTENREAFDEVVETARSETAEYAGWARLQG